MRRTHPLLALMAALCLGFVVTACGGDDDKYSSSSSSSSSSDAPGNEIQKVSGAESKPTITVGSKNFPEQFVLGEIYSQALEAAGFKVKTSLDIGSELIAHKALQGGKIDAYPEYTGTALTIVLRGQDRRRPSATPTRPTRTRRPASPRRTSPRSPRRRSRTPTGSA